MADAPASLHTQIGKHSEDAAVRQIEDHSRSLQTSISASSNGCLEMTPSKSWAHQYDGAEGDGETTYCSNPTRTNASARTYKSTYKRAKFHYPNATPCLQSRWRLGGWGSTSVEVFPSCPVWGVGTTRQSLLLSTPTLPMTMDPEHRQNRRIPGLANECTRSELHVNRAQATPTPNGSHSLLRHAVNVAGSGGRRVLTILHEVPL